MIDSTEPQEFKFVVFDRHDSFDCKMLSRATQFCIETDPLNGGFEVSTWGNAFPTIEVRVDDGELCVDLRNKQSDSDAVVKLRYDEEIGFYIYQNNIKKAGA